MRTYTDAELKEVAAIEAKFPDTLPAWPENESIVDAMARGIEIENMRLDELYLLERADQDPNFALANVGLPVIPNVIDHQKILPVLYERSKILTRYVTTPDEWEDIHIDALCENFTRNYTKEQLKAMIKAQSETPEEISKKKAADWLKERNRVKAMHEYYDMTAEAWELEQSKQYPVYPLRPEPGPVWNDDILYGPVGELIKKASVHNESHPAGMLVDFLISLGNIIGRGPFFTVNATRHYTNGYFVRVGSSSRSRKGTGRDAIDEVLKAVDSDWFYSRVVSGFGSGEAVIYQVRDSFMDQRMIKNKYESIMVPGVADKRLCIREGEMANILVLASKPESHADAILRDGWDGKPLRNTVKGRSHDGISNSAKCEEPHLSISADTTISELKAKMPSGAAENGFGNRFLYVYVYKTKDCPQGGPQLDWSNEALQFANIVKFAREQRYMPMTQSARNWWNQKYTKFEHEGPDGLASKMTARAAAHVHRIALLYALVDMSTEITREHFQAAEKLWDYCSESALFIFGGVNKEQQKIVEWIDMRGLVKYDLIRDDLYGKHRKTSLIKADLDALVKGKELIEKDGYYVTLRNNALLFSLPQKQ